MKTLLAAVLVLTCLSSAYAFETTAKVDLAGASHYIASPTFGKLLAEATDAAQGWKIRMDYTTDRTSRTTNEILSVTVVGQALGAPTPKYLKAHFELRGINGGSNIDGATAVEKSEITQEEFVQFKE